MLLNAPAKINLTLKILSKRADGYHEISSLMRGIRLFDEVTIDVRETESSRIQVCADTSAIPDGPENLAYRAAALVLAKYAAFPRAFPAALSFTVSVNLKKYIPVAAGLAGGSADAAAVLLGLAKLLAPEIGIREIAAWGASLGADVPFCVYVCAAANPTLGYPGAVTARAEGIGDRLDFSSDLICEPTPVLLVKPSVSVPTKEIYALYDSATKKRNNDSENDLEPVCADAYPVVAETIATLKAICAGENTCAKIQLSGSGPTVFAYFDGADRAAIGRVHARAAATFPRMFVCLTETL